MADSSLGLRRALGAHCCASPQPLPLLASGSLDAYLQTVREIPVLSSAEELRLARRLRLEGDAGAAQSLVLSSLRFVVHIARSYLGYGLAFADLIQEGNVGLLKAVKRYDPGVGVRLISFAVHWIKAEIHEFILRNWRIVKIATTKAQRKLFFNLRRYKKRLGWMSQGEVEKVAAELDVGVADVLQMDARLSQSDIGFDVAVDDDETPRYAPARQLRDTADNASELEDSDWRTHCGAHLQGALAKLDPRSREIVQRRWLSPESPQATLQSLADQFGISAERVRQIQTRALQTLRGALDAAEHPTCAAA